MQCVLQDNLWLYPNITDVYEVTLYEKCLVYEKIEGGTQDHRTEVLLEDIIGCHVMKAGSNFPSVRKNTSFFCIYAYVLTQKHKNSSSAGKKDRQKREKRTYVFEVAKFENYEDNLGVSRRWQSAFLWLIRGCKLHRNTDGQVIIPSELPAQRHFLVLVNPKSGPGRSLEIFLEKVRPILAEADISHLLLVTERQNHGKEFVRNVDLTQWSGILVISGDGLLYEVYNGLMERPDWKTAVKIPIGVVPGGSGNGLARSICHASNEPYLYDPVLACTLCIIKGKTTPMDLVRVDTPNGPIYSFLTIGWGIMSDIDIESERLRSIGEARFTLWAFWRVFKLRFYNGRISYLPASEFNSVQIPRPHFRRISSMDTSLPPQQNGSSSPPPTARSFTRSRTFENGCTTNGNGHEQEFSLVRVSDATVQRSKLNLNLCEDVPVPLDDVPDLKDPVPSDWVVEEGQFILVYASIQTHLGTNIFFAPDARLNDGVIWLVIIKGNVNRRQIMNYLLAQEQGNHIKLPYVRFIPVKAFRLESFGDNLITVDGETVPSKVVQAHVMPSVGRVLTV